jgi:uncharacterized protein YnzC (UPF0291/DUF896 family)
VPFSLVALRLRNLFDVVPRLSVDYDTRHQREYDRNYQKKRYDSMTDAERTDYLKKKADYARNRRKEKGLVTWTLAEDPHLRQEYLELMRGKTCACCSSVEHIGLDHIVPSRKNKGKHGGGNSWAKSFLEYKSNPLSFQFLCRICNSSKGVGCYCIRHKKYLGLWGRVIPDLPDMLENEEF